MRDEVMYLHQGCLDCDWRGTRACMDMIEENERGPVGAVRVIGERADLAFALGWAKTVPQTPGRREAV